jgi:hypothetical protein
MMDSKPARTCGACTLCCTALVVETPEFRKMAGVTCTHCTAAGCGIYERRFPICRSYHCGWIHSPELGDDWRPDISGVMVMPVTENVPTEFAVREGVELLVVGGADAIRKPAFAPFVLNLVVNQVPVWLGVPGPVGYYPARALLNRPLAAAAAARDVERVRDVLQQIHRSAAGHAFERVAFA